MKAKIVVITALTIWMVSAVMAQEVSVNYNHDKNFAQYHTYAWGGNNQNQIANSILFEQAQGDINSALQAKGLQKVEESANPDLIVTASGGEKEQTSYNVWSSGGRWFGGGMGGITPEQNVEGTMIVSLYDVKAKELVWRGVSADTLDKSGNKNQKHVNKAIEKMFKQWPKQ